jgi:cell division septum initiation protein DivIVA
MSSANNGDAVEDELKEGEDRDDTLAKLGGVAVVLGLLAEVWLAFKFAKGVSILEEWGPIVADALVALGVTTEILFAARARSKAEARKLLSDAKVAEAQKTAADAIERAAILEKEAAEARERTAEIEKLTAWRRIKPEQYSSIIKAIRASAAEIDLLVEYERGVAEAFSYARQIAWAFQQAGVTKIRGDANSYWAPGVFGVRIASEPAIDILSIMDAFSAAGIELVTDSTDLSRHLPRNVPAPNLYFFVAPKTPPDFGLPVQPVGESSIQLPYFVSGTGEKQCRRSTTRLRRVRFENSMTTTAPFLMVRLALLKR